MRFSKLVMGVCVLPPTAYASVVPRSNAATSYPVPVSYPKTCHLQDKFPLATTSDWTHVKIAGNLTDPRGLITDTQGNLLLVESGKGVTAFTLSSNGCVAHKKTLISNTALNHGITLSPNGTFLYVSSTTTAWQYSYDPEAVAASKQKVIVKNMKTSGHSTRTLLIAPRTPNLLIVSHGSDGNLDQGSIDKKNGRAMVKAFYIPSAGSSGHEWSTAGHYLGYGLRNEVALAADNNNKLWGVENSGDNFHRTVGGKSTDIHNGNPAEELNYLGDPGYPNEKWYGYPSCFTVWDGKLFPDSRWKTGYVFTPAPSQSLSDQTCQAKSVAPRLSIESHGAPMDAKFDKANNNMYVTLHGSWNSDSPTGYKVIEIPYQKSSAKSGGGYEPVAEQDSSEGYRKILWDTQSACNSGKCLRPVGLTWDRAYSRMFFASDGAEGEIYTLFKKK